MAENRKWKVLVAETVGEAGLQMLRDAPDIELIEEVGMSREDLLKKLPEMDAVLTRSGTKMDEEALNAAVNLKVVARAGVGVDNVNVPIASRKGVVVINAPTGNTLAAAELTMALMLGLVRKVPQAFGSLRSGEWDRKRFSGHQLSGKKVLVLGLGRIGVAVAQRCRAFGMDVIAYDPYTPKKKAESLGIPMREDLADALSIADVVTIHMPLTPDTANMIDEKTLKAFKKGAYLINCARGGIVDEKAAADAVRDGRLSGIAFDVYTAEPLCEGHPFLAKDIEDKIIITPHLGASTEEAQTEVAKIAAANMIAALRGEPYDHAVNLPFLEQKLNKAQMAFLQLSRKMGIMGAKLAETECGAIHSCHIMLRGDMFAEDEPLPNRLCAYSIAVLKGLFEVISGPEVSYMLAPLLAKDSGLSVDEGIGDPKTYKNTVEVKLDAEKCNVSLIGTITEEGRMRIVKVNEYWLDFVPSGKLILFQNHDRPGVIGKIGNILGDAKINIANFALGRKDNSGLALGALEVDSDIDELTKKKLEKSGDMLWLTLIDFTDAE
ncbi:MAG: phosphoglycerate dehydrogenase [Synergistaceae bacterium]|nr:phosphoglycerate dehydrogenase [Synergistaceae bacterium]